MFQSNLLSHDQMTLVECTRTLLPMTVGAGPALTSGRRSIKASFACAAQCRLALIGKQCFTETIRIWLRGE
jgi:hypothetical protein